ncbi:MAG: hypothetical protein QOH21_1428 [Acidobacteriota bacterium]|nr:hypothetical protein [Acidobacteriota bacterium]
MCETVTCPTLDRISDSTRIASAEAEHDKTPAIAEVLSVGDTGFEPVTSSVSGNGGGTADVRLWERLDAPAARAGCGGVVMFVEE